MAASVELLSEHPLGKAVVNCYKSEYGAELEPVHHFQMIPGRGVCAQTEAAELLAGNLELLNEHGVFMESVPTVDETICKGGLLSIFRQTVCLPAISLSPIRCGKKAQI